MKQRITLWMGLWTMGMVLAATAADYTVTSALDDETAGTGVSLNARGMARSAQPDLMAFAFIPLRAPTLMPMR